MKQEPKSTLSRRALFAGAGTAGAVVAAASLAPAAMQPNVAATEAREPPPRGGGYQLTAHVKRYYQTTLV